MILMNFLVVAMSSAIPSSLRMQPLCIHSFGNNFKYIVAVCVVTTTPSSVCVCHRLVFIQVCCCSYFPFFFENCYELLCVCQLVQGFGRLLELRCQQSVGVAELRDVGVVYFRVVLALCAA